MSKSTLQPSSTDAAETPLAVSEYHRLLASKRRRVTLSILAAETGQISLERLATAVAARQSDVADDEASVDEVRITLHHTHLPKLAAAGAVEYDQTRHLVRPVESRD